MASRVQIPLAVETFDKTTGFVLPVNKATITITDRTTSTPATVYAAEEGGATITPTTDEHGQVTGWVEEGAYVVVASGGTAPVTIAPTTYDFDGITGRVAVAGGRGLVEKDIEALLGKSIEFIKQAICPSGTMLAYGGAGAPAGWLLCDGSSYLRATYPTLFSAIGGTYGAVDGSHFNVPDTRGRTLIGAGGGPSLTLRNLGDKGGEETYELKVGQMPSHNHTGATGTANTSTESNFHQHGVGSYGITGAVQTSDLEAFFLMGSAAGSFYGFGQSSGIVGMWRANIGYHAHTHALAGASDNQNQLHVHLAGPLSIPAEGSNTPHPNMQPYTVANSIIKI